LETLWWPRHAVTIAARARNKPDDWRDDLVNSGVKPGDIIEFYAENVVGRLRLLVRANGSYTTESEFLPPKSTRDLLWVTHEGEAAQSLEELIGRVYELAKDQPSYFPLVYQVRVSIVRSPIKMRLQFVDDGVLKFQPV
jgi:hypothetical protein